MKKLIPLVAMVLVLVTNAQAQRPVAEFEAFWNQFRAAVLRDDKSQIAALTSFPFTTRGPLDRDPTIKHSRTWFLKKIDGLLAQKHYRYEGDKLKPFTMRDLIEEKQTITEKDLNGGGNRVWIEDFIFDKRRGRWSFTFAYTEK
jgi:hypothetical protein